MKFDYDKLSGILHDVTNAIITFVKYMKAFIGGFKTEYTVPTESFEEAQTAAE